MSFEGGTHDLAMIKEDPAGGLNPCTKGTRPKRTGYGCLQTRDARNVNHYEGIALEMPEKKKPRSELTQQQKDSNKRISAKRVRRGSTPSEE